MGLLYETNPRTREHPVHQPVRHKQPPSVGEWSMRTCDRIQIGACLLAHGISRPIKHWKLIIDEEAEAPPWVLMTRIAQINAFTGSAITCTWPMLKMRQCSIFVEGCRPLQNRIGRCGESMEMIQPDAVPTISPCSRLRARC